MPCEHKNLDPYIAGVIEPTSSNKGVVVDVRCRDCGLFGAVSIEPEDVDWGEPAEASGRQVLDAVLSATSQKVVSPKSHEPRPFAELDEDDMGLDHG